MSPAPFDRFAPRTEEIPLLRNPVVWAALVIVLAVGASLYFWRERLEQEKQTAQEARPPEEGTEQQTAPPVPVPESASEGDTESEIRYPLPAVAPPPRAEGKALPPLSESDAPVQELLADTAEKGAFTDFPLTRDIVRRIVSTVDNLPRKHVATRVLPVKPPAGQIVTRTRGEVVQLSPRNSARYARYVALTKAVDAKKLVAIYVYFYPLFQQSYEELGYPRKYFNDRLVEVLDHLLQTPEVQGPVELVRPKVFFEFADPELEDLSAGQKILVRIGPDNAAAIKAKLREIRRELVLEKLAPGM